MSWIVQSLWLTLREKRDEYRTLLNSDPFRAFETINRIAYEVGRNYGVLLQLNFPPGGHPPGLNGLGHRDLSILVSRKEKFDTVSELEVKKVFGRLNPLALEPLFSNREGFKAMLPHGRIDCLPGGIHLWCKITPETLEVVDWLFTNAYGLTPD